MKKLLCAAGLGIALAASAGVQAAEKIAIVNVTDIFQKSPQRDAVSKKLEGEFKSRASELQNLEKDLQSKMQQLQRDGRTMKDADRTKLEKDIITKRDSFASKAKSFEEDNRRRQMEERGKILKNIQSAVSDVAKKNGYDLVIDANAVAYAGSVTDITSDVLKQVK